MPDPAARTGLDVLAALAAEVAACRRCPRLTAYREAVAARPRPAYRGERYWGRPVPGFGDPAARLLIIGLAPAAHGANRTGRMFTGDSSGDWLFRALHRAGFANQPESRARSDGLTLRGAYVTASCRCAPPENRPSTGELAACRPFLERELALLQRVEVVVVLGRIAFDTYLRVRRAQGWGWPAAAGRGGGAAPARDRGPGTGGRAARPHRRGHRPQPGGTTTRSWRLSPRRWRSERRTSVPNSSGSRLNSTTIPPRNASPG